jgi:RES domain-containing protein
MPLSDLIKPWSGVALRHVPAGAPFDVLDFRFAGRGAENRWNEPGRSTLYLAGDEGVLIAEWGRHFVLDRAPELRRRAIERAVYRLDLAIEHGIDLRDRAVLDALSLADAPVCFMDVNVARATAHFVRDTTEAQAILVPSMGFLDDLDRWCFVVFLDKLPDDPRRFISAVTPHGPIRWG